jgi:enterochelin esterase-like enzyme
MALQHFKSIRIEQKKIRPGYLNREVTVDFYLPVNFPTSELSLLFINDGQDLTRMDFANMLDGLIASAQITPVLCVGIHAGDRLSEFGTAHIPDYKKRGATAFSYQQFLVQELLPMVHIMYDIEKFKTTAIAGFSLGGLSAIDTLWNYPEVFSVVGIFSGSLWWRTKGLEDGYKEETDRIIHQKIKNGKYYPGLRFYFTTGSLDEIADRNNNGIIDSIDDTVALIEELQRLGYDTNHDIRYTNYEDGKHDVETWRKAMPSFLLWVWGKKQEAVI